MFDLHQRQAIGVHQRHEDAAEQIVERREQDQREQPRNAAHDAKGAGEVDATGRVVRVRFARLVDMDEEEMKRGEQ